MQARAIARIPHRKRKEVVASAGIKLAGEASRHDDRPAGGESGEDWIHETTIMQVRVREQ